MAQVVVHKVTLHILQSSVSASVHNGHIKHILIIYKKNIVYSAVGKKAHLYQSVICRIMYERFKPYSLVLPEENGYKSKSKKVNLVGVMLMKFC